MGEARDDTRPWPHLTVRGCNPSGNYSFGLGIGMDGVLIGALGAVAGAAGIVTGAALGVQELQPVSHGVQQLGSQANRLRKSRCSSPSWHDGVHASV